MKYLLLTVCLWSPLQAAGQTALPWAQRGLEFRTYLKHPLSRYMDYSDPYHAWYTVSPGGIYHTQDLGETMQRLPTVGIDNLTFSGLAQAYSRPHILVVITGEHYRGNDSRWWKKNPRFPGNGIYWSGNRGESWRHLPLDLNREDLRYLEDVDISASGDTILVASHHRVMRSADGGQTWTQILLLPVPRYFHPHAVPLTSIVVHPQNMHHIFVVANRDTSGVPRNPKPDWCTRKVCTTSFATQRIYQSRDGGDTWTVPAVFNSGLPGRYPDQEGWDIAFSLPQPGVVWAISKLGVLLRSEDGGGTWNPVPVDSWKPNADFSSAYFRRRVLRPHPSNSDSLYFGHIHANYLGIYEKGHVSNAIGQVSFNSGGTSDFILPSRTGEHKLAYVSEMSDWTYIKILK